MNDGPRPLDRIEPGRLAPTVREHFPAHGFLLLVDAFGVDRDDDALHAVARAGFADKIRLIDRSGIDADFVGTGRQQRADVRAVADRSEEHTSELQSLMRISYAVFCLKKKN